MKVFSFYSRMVVSIMMLIVPFVLSGCGDDDGVVSGQELIPVTASNSNLLSGQTYTFPNGSAINSSLAGQETNLAFGSVSGTSGSFTLNTTGNTASGNVTIGSCILTITSSTYPGLPVGTTISFSPCNLRVSFANVVVGGDKVVGDIAFEVVNQANGQTGQSNTAPRDVRLAPDGSLEVDNGSGTFIDTGVEIKFTGTGSITG